MNTEYVMCFKRYPGIPIRRSFNEAWTSLSRMIIRWIFRTIVYNCTFLIIVSKIKLLRNKFYYLHNVSCLISEMITEGVNWRKSDVASLPDSGESISIMAGVMQSVVTNEMAGDGSPITRDKKDVLQSEVTIKLEG